MPYLLTLVGLLCFLEGLPYFAMPEATKRFLRMLSERPGGELRKIGGVLMVLGLVLVYFGRHHGG